MSVTLENGGIFAGAYTVGDSLGESTVTDIYTALDRFADEGVSSLAAINGCSGGYAVCSGDGDDTLSLTGKTAVIGTVSLAGGRNAVSIERGSYLHGCISAEEGSLSLNMKRTDIEADALPEPDVMPGNSRNGGRIVHPGMASLASALTCRISMWTLPRRETGHTNS